MCSWRDPKEQESILKDSFRLEFINRIDEVVTFNALDEESIFEIIDVEILNKNEKLKTKGLQLNLDNNSKKAILKQGFDDQFGARSIKRFMQKDLDTLISKQLIKEKIFKDATIKVFYDTEFEIKIEKK